MDANIRPVRVMPEQVARKIAAGEVVERPASVVRELIDNSIDAKANRIIIRLIEGGNELIQVQDDGSGMSMEDLGLCYLSHASSKVFDEADLYAIETLGFRGEALAAVSNISKLSIKSGRQNQSHELLVDGGTFISLKPCEAMRGTLIEVRDLFYNLPARRQFMKRSSTEFSQCLSVINDKACAHPEIEFKVFHNDELRLFLPRQASRLDRIWEVYKKEIGPKKFMNTIKGSHADLEFEIILSSIDIYRHDKKFLHLFVNTRRIWDYGLSQALEYGYTGLLPGGRFPFAFCFMKVSPQKLDINIHPAKREVKLSQYSEIHKRIVELINSYLKHQKPTFASTDSSMTLPSSQVLPTISYGYPSEDARNDLHELALMEKPIKKMDEDLRFTYHGLIFGCFLMFDFENDLYLLDMHAAHERINFDEFFKNPKKQELLIPLQIDLDGLSERWLDREIDSLQKIGIAIKSSGNGQFELLELPHWLVNKEDVFINFLKNPHSSAQEAFRNLAATVACRAAIKKGDPIDDSFAFELIQKSLKLPEPRCPHGRPIWKIISHDELMTFIGRHV